MPVTEERIDALERDVAEIRGQIFEVRTTQTLHTTALVQCKEQLGYLRTGQHELRKGQEELRTTTAELCATVDDLRTGQDELRKGQDALRAETAELRKGQDELRADTAALRADTASIRETLDRFHSAFAVVLDEIRQQKAWREEFSGKLARVIAKSEGLDA